MKKALVLSKASLHNGPRYIREFEMLKNDFKIFALGISKPNNNFVEYIDFYLDIRNNLIDKIKDKLLSIINLNNPFAFSFFVRKKLVKTIKVIDPDIIIIHTPIFIPFIFEYFPTRKFKVIFNAHEYHPLEFEDNIEWLNSFGVFYHKIYSKYLNKLDLLINVCDGIAEKCLEVYHKESIVIPNAALYHEIEPVYNHNGPIRVIHHGACIRSRNIDLMIDIMGQLPDKYQFDLMLTKNDPEYYSRLLKLSLKYKNIKFLEPVPFDKIIPFINQYDIGFYIIQPTNFNNRYSLPNKFFEYIQSRICIVISPTIEMKNIVENENIGIVVSDFNIINYIEIFNKLTFLEINNFKNNTHNISQKFSFESYENIYKEKIFNLLK